MKRTIRNSILTLAVAGLFPAAAMAYESMAATIRVSGGGVYDYVVVGESAKATDGFDNAYDTLAPSESLNSTWISANFSHPDWKAPKTTFRGDIRSLATQQTWILNISSTLAQGTPLKVALTPGLNILPEKLILTVSDTATSASAELKNGSLTVLSPAPGTIKQLTITATQPVGDTPQPVVTPTTADGDVDGDGQTSVADAMKVLRMALGLESTSATTLSHGDMNGDGKLTIQDALLVLRKSVGL